MPEHGSPTAADPETLGFEHIRYVRDADAGVATVTIDQPDELGPQFARFRDFTGRSRAQRNNHPLGCARQVNGKHATGRRLSGGQRFAVQPDHRNLMGGTIGRAGPPQPVECGG